MKILVACERSGKVRDALIAKGHDAMSCDLHPSDRPGPHYQGDVRGILYGKWDGLIAFPDCRYLCNSGSKHLYTGMKKINGICPVRWARLVAAARFFNLLWNADHILKRAIENSIMHCHAKAKIGQQTQVIQPHHHGHKEMKATCLWLHGLPKLERSNDVGPPPKDPIERRKWAVVHRMPPGPDRERKRSETYQGIADAMADQWFV